MKKTNKLLSLLTAVAITFSAFTGLVVPASAEGETSGGKVEWTFAAAPDGTKLTNSSSKEKEWYIEDKDLGNGLTAHSVGTLDESKQEYSNAFEVDRSGKTTFTVGETAEEVVGSLKFGGKSSATGRYFTYTPTSAGTLTAYVKHGSATKPNTDIRKLIITQGEATPVEIATIGTDAPNLVGTANVVANQEVKITCDNNVALAKLVFTPSANTPSTDPTPTATAAAPATDPTPTATAAAPATDPTPTATAAAPAADPTPTATTAAADPTPTATAAAPAADPTPTATTAAADPTPTATVAPIDPKATIDFTNRSLTAEAKGNTTTFEVTDAATTGATALAAAGAGNVLKLGSSQNGASKNLGYTAPLATDTKGVVEYSGVVDLSFKLEPMQIREGRTDIVNVQFTDIQKTAIFPIEVGASTANIKVNGKTIDTEFGKYYVITEKLDFDNKKGSITVADAAGKELYKAEDVALTATNLAYMHFDNTDWRYGYCAIDDIQLDATQIGAPVYYTVTINTERYAKLVTSDNKTYYADVNGKVEIPLLKPGTTFDYTISKVGYSEAKGNVPALAADFSDDKPITKTDENTLFIESEFGNASEAYVSPGGNRNDTFSLGSIELPETSSFDVTFNFAGFGNNTGQQKTWYITTDAGALVGLMIVDNTMYAWTEWKGSANYNQSDDIGGGRGNSAVLTDAVPVGKDFDVSFVIDTKNKAITAAYGETSVSLPYTMDAKTITGLGTGLYRYNGELQTKEVKLTKPDPMFMLVTGDGLFAKVSGKTITRTYGRTETVITPDETFTWKVDRPNEVTKKGAKFTVTAPAEDMTAKAIVAAYNNGKLKSLKTSDVTVKAGQTEVMVEETADNAIVMLWKSMESMEPLAPAETVKEYKETIDNVAGMDGISIDNDGVLTVTDAAAPGYITITATGTTGKTASKTVEIKDFATVKMTADGPQNYEAGQTGTYKVTSLVDEYNANVIDLFAPSFASDNTDVITIDAATGVATAVAAGTANITVKAGNPGKEATVKIPVTVASYSIVANATENSTVVDISGIKTDSAITGYQVTTATAEGAKVNQSTIAKADVTDNKITADTTGAAKVEVAPVYETKINTVMNVPAGRYNVTVTAGNGRRSDVYVNDQMMFNNINQGGDNWVLAIREIQESTDYTVNDVVIGEGYAKFNLRDDQSGGTLITNVKFVKSPSIVTRPTRIYVIGDSLVANYHGTAPEGKEGFVRTGWGQVLQSYIKNAEVTNLGNSGAWATGMYSDAFTNVQKSAQPGDIVIWESGYNDRNHGGADPMIEAMTKVANECKDLGVKLFFVTPNASWHDYSENVVLSASVRTLAESLDNVTLIDLAKESYGFLNGRYGALEEDARKLIIVGANGVAGHYNNATWNATSGAIEGDKGLHSTFNAANCWAAIVANNLLRYDDTKKYVDTGVKYTFNDTLSDIAVDAATIVTAQTDTPTE